MLKQNLDYWEISLKNPEPIIDEYYTFNKLIVQNQNLIQKVERLRELITTYCVLLKIDRQALSKVLDEIYMIALEHTIHRVYSLLENFGPFLFIFPSDTRTG